MCLSTLIFRQLQRLFYKKKIKETSQGPFSVSSISCFSYFDILGSFPYWVSLFYSTMTFGLSVPWHLHVNQCYKHHYGLHSLDSLLAVKKVSLGILLLLGWAGKLDCLFSLPWVSTRFTFICEFQINNAKSCLTVYLLSTVIASFHLST